MTALITADLHLSANPRDVYRKRWVEKLPSLIETLGAELLIILGDLTEVKDGHEAELVNFMVDKIHACAQQVPVVIVQGNHDWLSGPDNAYFRFLQHLPNVVWVDSPLPMDKHILLPDAKWDAVFLPHSTNPAKDWDFLGDRKTFYDFAFCHQCFSGAKSERGKVLEGTPLGLIPKRSRVISGDVHNPQDVSRQLTYVGAPYTIDFGDAYAPRVMTIDNDGNIRSIPCEGPQKVHIEISDPKIFDQVKKLEELDLIAGDVVKFSIDLTKEQYQEWPELQKKIRDWAAKKKLMLMGLIPSVETAVPKKLNLIRATVQADPDVVKNFAQSRGIDKPTTQTGLGLLK